MKFVNHPCVGIHFLLSFHERFVDAILGFNLEKYPRGRRGRFAKSLDVKACEGSNPSFSAIDPVTPAVAGFLDPSDTNLILKFITSKQIPLILESSVLQGPSYYQWFGSTGGHRAVRRFK